MEELLIGLNRKVRPLKNKSHLHCLEIKPFNPSYLQVKDIKLDV